MKLTSLNSISQRFTGTSAASQAVKIGDFVFTDEPVIIMGYRSQIFAGAGQLIPIKDNGEATGAIVAFPVTAPSIITDTAVFRSGNGITIEKGGHLGLYFYDTGAPHAIVCQVALWYKPLSSVETGQYFGTSLENMFKAIELNPNFNLQPVEA